MPENSKTVLESFASERAAVRRVRHFVTSFAGQFIFSEEKLADIEIAASELATNAIEHGLGDDFSVQLRVTPETLDMLVRSIGSAVLPVVREVGPEELSGRGLRIASSVADEFSLAATHNGVLVTCIFKR